jgi:GT2 family glycosyltransferase
MKPSANGGVVENKNLKHIAATDYIGAAVPLDLSVVVPAFNDRGHLGDVLRALANQRPPVREIIVSHSGNGDPRHHLPPSLVPIRVLHQDERRFSGAARNAGCAVTTGSWLAFVDDDVIPAKDWSARLARVLADGIVNTCVVGSVDADVSGGYWGMCLWFVEFGSVHSYMPSRPIEGGASANMFLPRSFYKGVGGFPEHVERCVDVEFMARCRKSGGHTRFVRELKVSHRNIGGLRHCLGQARSLGCGSARIRHLAKLLSRQ